jgi:hypothetical protein
VDTSSSSSLDWTCSDGIAELLFNVTPIMMLS